MATRYVIGDEHSVNLFTEFSTYEEAEEEARAQARRGRTAVIYKAVPCAYYKPHIQIEEGKYPEAGF